MITEQTRPQPSHSEGLPALLQPEDPSALLEPDDVSPQTGGVEWGTVPAAPTYEDYQARGDEAYSRAMELEKTQGLSPETVDAYRDASVNLLSVTATGPIDHVRRESEPADPVRLLKIAGSLAKQAQATPRGEFYDTYGSRHIDIKSNKRRIAAETLQRASRMMMGEEIYADHAAAAAEFDDDESPAEVFVSAVVEAAKETGTAEYVFGAEAVDKDTPERLETEGEDALARFIGEHAMESGPQGLEFVARTAEIAVEEIEEMTAEHKLPVAV